MISGSLLTIAQSRFMVYQAAVRNSGGARIRRRRSGSGPSSSHRRRSRGKWRVARTRYTGLDAAFTSAVHAGAACPARAASSSVIPAAITIFNSGSAWGRGTRFNRIPREPRERRRVRRVRRRQRSAANRFFRGWQLAGERLEGLDNPLSRDNRSTRASCYVALVARSIRRQALRQANLSRARAVPFGRLRSGSTPMSDRLCCTSDGLLRLLRSLCPWRQLPSRSETTGGAAGAMFARCMDASPSSPSGPSTRRRRGR